MKYYIINDTRTLCLKIEGESTIHLKLSHANPGIKRSRTGGVIEDILEVAEDYLNSLPLEIQKEYYGHVKKVYNERYRYSHLMKMEDVINYYHDAIKELCKVPGINMEDIYVWVSENIEVPESIERNFDKKLARTNGHSREQTYVSTEYQWLNTLAIMIKLFSPWNVIFQGIECRSWIGNRSMAQDKIGEYLVYKVYPESIRSSDPFQKLVAFVKKRKSVNDIPGYKIVDNFVSDESIGRYIISSLISKLMISPVKRNVDKKNLVATLYSTLEGHFKPERKKDIRVKVTSSTDPSGELDKSVAETYKDRSKYFIHEQVILMHVAKFNNAIKPLKSLLHIGEVRTIYAKLLANKEMTFTGIHEALCANTLRWVVSQDIYGLLSYEELKGLLAITSYLLKKNHKELSLLCLSGAETEEVNGEMVLKRTSVNTMSGSRFLHVIHAYPIRLTTMTDNPIPVTVKNNVVIEYLRKISTTTAYTWIPITDDPWYDDIIVEEDGQRKIRPMPDIQNLLGLWLADLDNIGNVPDDLLEEALSGTMEF